MFKKYSLGFVLLCTASLSTVFAATPTLTLTPSGDGNNVNVVITNADPGTQAALYYNSTVTNSLQLLNIGYTDGTGVASSTVSTTINHINSAVPVYVIVNGYSSLTTTWPYSIATTTTGITFNNTAPTVVTGQTIYVTISGGSNVYSVSSNSSSAVIQPSITSNSLALYGNAPGTANLTICSSDGTCGNITVTVTNASGATETITLSQNSLSLTQGQTGTVSVAGGTTPYTVTSNAPNVASGSVSGSILSVSGIGQGNATLTICSALNVCSSLAVTVNSSVSNNTVTIGVPVSIGQTLSLSLSGGNGSYYLTSSPTSPVTATIAGTTLSVKGVAQGSISLVVCSSASVCTPINFNVSGYVVTNPITYTPTPTPGVSAGSSSANRYIFTLPLSLGANNNEVMQLQLRLRSEGFLTAGATGYFGAITEAAVKAYQIAHKLTPLGSVGPGTRASLNQ